MPGMPGCRERDVAQMAAMEQRIERFIMNNDDYNSIACGKEAERKISWLIVAGWASEY